MALKHFVERLHPTFYRFMREQPEGKIWTAVGFAQEFNKYVRLDYHKLTSRGTHFFLKSQNRYKIEIIKKIRGRYRFKLIKNEKKK